MNTKCNRLPCHTSKNSRSEWQCEHMEWDWNIFRKVQLVKIMARIIRRVRIHRPYCAWPLKYRNLHFLTVTYFPRYIFHVIVRHVAVIRLPSQYCEKGSAFEFLPQVSYLGHSVFSFRLKLIPTANTRVGILILATPR